MPITFSVSEVESAKIVAGLLGVAQAPLTRALAPEFGWAVIEELSH